MATEKFHPFANETALNLLSGQISSYTSRRQKRFTPSLSFVCAPWRSTLQYPTCRPKSPAACCPCNTEKVSSAPSIRRRQVIQTLSLIPMSFLPSHCFATSADDLVFTKLPCEGESCRPVEIHDYRVGSGRPAENGYRITVKWTGRLADRYGWPIQKEDADEVSYLLGKDKLIRGFEIAIEGMREGGKRRMIIPAELGYMDEKSGPLPASYGDRRRLFATVLNSRRFKRAGDLVIDVQLLKVRSPR